MKMKVQVTVGQAFLSNPFAFNLNLVSYFLNAETICNSQDRQGENKNINKRWAIAKME